VIHPSRLCRHICVVLLYINYVLLPHVYKLKGERTISHDQKLKRWDCRSLPARLHVAVSHKIIAEYTCRMSEVTPNTILLNKYIFILLCNLHHHHWHSSPQSITQNTENKWYIIYTVHICSTWKSTCITKIIQLCFTQHFIIDMSSITGRHECLIVSLTLSLNL
jgi:hypothetical protein